MNYFVPSPLLRLFLFLAVFVSTSPDTLSSPLLTSDRSTALVNSISGQVWDPFNRPVPNIYVELQNELYSTISRQRTTSAGLYNFSGMSAGNFKVKILTIGTDYLEQVKDVQLISLVQGMSDSQQVDFYLRYDPRRIALGSGGLPSEIFAQDGIPREAEKHYRKGLSFLQDKKKDLALAEFERAITIFPSYFAALNSLGTELVEKGEFRRSLEPLIKSIDVNQRSYSSFYALAYACYQLSEIPQAIEAARATTVIKPASTNAHLLYGTVLRISGNYDLAEQSLMKAKKLGQDKVPQVNWQLSLVYNRLRKNKQAADELETFLKNQPDAPNKKEVLELISKLRNSNSE